MPRTPRLYISGMIYEVCFRTEEGLPLVCSPFMRVILEGILVSAFSRYRAKLLSYVVMGNHIHMHVRVEDPEHVDDIVCYIKRESAHAINNLLGRRRRTVWIEGYDAVLILDGEKMIDRLAYIFLNVARANLETSIDNYPGLSSWTSLTTGAHTLKGRRIPRERIPALPNRAMSFLEQQSFAEELLRDALPEQQIVIDPLVFFEVFSGTRHLDREDVRQKIIRRVRTEESVLAQARKDPVIGAHALRLASMHARYMSKKFGKKMWCFGSTRAIRLPYIVWMKERLSERLQLRNSLQLSEFLQSLPPGFFAPGGILRANVVPMAIPIG